MSSRKLPRALVTAPFRGEGMALLETIVDIVYEPWIDHVPLKVLGPEPLAERIREVEADVVICEADFCMGPVLDLPLRAIGSTRGDPSNVDVAAATRNLIPVLHAPGRNADGVAEFTIALLLAATRQIVAADRDLRAGKVVKDGAIAYQRFRAWQLAGRTAGLIGLGSVGRAVAWRLEGLGMRVIAHDPFNDDAKHSLEELLSESDVVSVHASPSADTLGMIGAPQFEQMKDGAVYINSARAGLHDLDALTQALEVGKLSAVGLDHFDGERLPREHPLLSTTNAVLTPHIGGATYDTEANHSRMIAEDLERLFSGKPPLYIANPEVLGASE